MKKKRLITFGIVIITAIISICCNGISAMGVYSVSENGEIYTYRGLLDHFFQESGYTLELRLNLDSEYGQWLNLAEFKTYDSTGKLIKYQSYTQDQLKSAPMILVTDDEAAKGNYTVEILVHSLLKPLTSQILDVVGTIEGTIVGSGNPEGTVIGWGVNDCPDFARGREYPGWFSYRLRLGGCIWITPAIYVRNTGETIYSTDTLGGYDLQGVHYYPGRAFIARLKDVLNDDPNTNLDDQPFSYAVCANDKVNLIEFVGNSYTDSYNSDIGPYSVSRTNSGGNIRSNSSIRLTGNVLINGNATPGPGGTVDLSGNAKVTGSTAPASSFVYFPPIKDLTASETLSISGNNSITLNTGTYYYNAVNITGNGTLYINGKVEIYCLGDFIAGGNGIVNNDGIASGVSTNLSIFVKGNNAEIIGNGKFYGTIYAPNATVKVTGNGDLYGSIVGRRVEVSGNAGIHWDQALLHKEVPGWWDPYRNSYVSAWEDLPDGRDRDYDDINYHITFSLESPVKSQAQAKVVVPKNGQTISGNAVSVVAEINDKTRAVQFQYRKEEEVSWIEIGPFDYELPYSATWNASVLEPGNYELRAVAQDRYGNCEIITDFITVSVVTGNADVEEDNQGGHKKKEKIMAMEDCDIGLADGAKIRIPYGVLTEQAFLLVTVVPMDKLWAILPSRSSSLRPIGVFYNFEFSNGMKLFGRNVTITLPYPDANRDGIVDGTNISASKLGIFWYNKDLMRWEEVTVGGGALTANVSHFSIYGIMAKGMASDLSSVKVYPNPYIPGEKTGKLYFEGLTNRATVKIYALDGTLVKTIEKDDVSEKKDWNGKNESNEDVGSGIYLYVITNSSGDKPATGKFLLIR